MARMWTWTWHSLLCVSLVSGLALDSNTIRSSKEVQQQNPQLQVERPVRRRVETPTSNSNRRRSSVACPAAGCDPSGCSNRAQRTSSQDRPVDRQLDADGHVHTDGFNRTKAPEMASCVRSGDCSPGLCCVRYLTGRRCQRIPTQGEACLLRGSSKMRRKLGRCECDAGLACRAEPEKAKGQGVCQPRQRGNQRKTRHSGKKRRTAERSC